MPKIKRRSFIRSMGLLSGACATGYASASTGNPANSGSLLNTNQQAFPAKPNIVFICVDQLRSLDRIPDSLPLPNLRRFKDQAINFANHHVTTSPCGPSRSVIYTGQHVTATGVIDNPNTGLAELDESVPTIGHYLRELGYRTAYKGKWHLTQIDEHETSAQDLESFGFSDYSTFGDPHGASATTGFIFDPLITDDAINWLQQSAPSNAPWFLAVNLVNPHDIMFHSTGTHQEQTRLNPDFIGRIERNKVYPDADWEVPLPPSFYQQAFNTEIEAVSHWRHVTTTMFGEIPLSNEAAWYDFQNQYFRCLVELDESLGRLFTAIEQHPDSEETLIVFTSDHGELAGAHGLRSKSGIAYAEAVQVPLLVKLPNQDKAIHHEPVTSHLDLVPSLLEFAGLTQEQLAITAPDLKGISFAARSIAMVEERETNGLLASRSDTLIMNSTIHTMDKDAIVLRILIDLPLRSLSQDKFKRMQWRFLEEQNFYRGIFDGRYKFCRYFNPNKHHQPTSWEMLTKHNQIELYDLHTDPDELHNLALAGNTYQDMILAMNDRLNSLIAREIGEDNGGQMPGPEFIWRLS